MNHSAKTKRLVMLLCASVAMGSSLSAVAAEHPWRSLYGDEILFDVYRDGTRVGNYRTQFSGEPTNWRVQATMKLDIEWLWLRFSYRYLGIEAWKNRQLERLEINIDDDGDQQQLVFNRQGKQLYAEDRAPIALPIFTTHHYDVAVTASTEVLNTLTGNHNQITVESLGMEWLEAGAHQVQAQRYRYHGELKDTDVWYDTKGRWVGLAFIDQRGARIEFKCLMCGLESPL